jgi:archaellum biogenesis ATPase FlaH
MAGSEAAQRLAKGLLGTHMEITYVQSEQGTTPLLEQHVLAQLSSAFLGH